MTSRFRFNPRVPLTEGAKGLPTAITSQFLANIDGLTADVAVIVGTTEAQTLTNKTIDGNDNTLTDIGTASLKTRTGVDAAVVTGTAGAASSLSMWNGDGDLVDAGILASLVLQSTAIGVTVQAYDATLQSLSSLGTAADRFAYTIDVDTWAEGTITAAGRAILDDADATAQRVTLGLEIGVNVQAYSANLDAFALKTAPTGAVVGTSDAQTLSAKTFSTPPIFPEHAVASLPSAATYDNGVIIVSDEVGGRTLATSDGTNWRRVSDGAIVS